MSKKLIKYLLKFKGIDANLFEHQEEWDLAGGWLRYGMTDQQISELEALAAKCP